MGPDSALGQQVSSGGLLKLLIVSVLVQSHLHDAHCLKETKKEDGIICQGLYIISVRTMFIVFCLVSEIDCYLCEEVVRGFVVFFQNV